MVLKSYAKLNLGLLVLNKRIDGFHNIETIFTSVTLYDKITMSKGVGITVECSDPNIPSGAENIAYKAAEMVKKEFGIKEGVKIFIKKNIPSGAGLAGGSGNGAAVVKGCLALWNIKATTKKIDKILSSLGSDVPYCYKGGTCYAKGRGEKLRELPPFKGYYIVIVNPGVHVSTPLAYKMLNRVLTAPLAKVRLLQAYRQLLTKHQLPSDLLVNDFEEVVFKKHPVIGYIKREFKELGADCALMSGSGSTVFALFRSRAKAKIAFTHFNGKGFCCRLVVGKK